VKELSSTNMLPDRYENDEKSRKAKPLGAAEE